MLICKASSEENRTDQSLGMTRKPRKEDFMEGVPEISGGGRGRSQKNFFWPFKPHFCLQIRGGWVPSLDSPLIMHCYVTCRNKSNVP